MTLFSNYNPKDGPGGKPISKDEAMKELIEVVCNISILFLQCAAGA